MADEKTQDNGCKPEEAEAEADCVLECVNRIDNELRVYIFAESTKVNKIACATILASMSQGIVHLEKEVMKNKFLEGRVCELEKRVQERRNVVVTKDNEGKESKEEVRTTAQQKSWAVVVKSNRSETVGADRHTVQVPSPRSVPRSRHKTRRVGMAR
ncbi:hypothetical protein Zmor_004057 [Zophobas morio]|uniref:Uncharacterized protein n=1 Tax=Zophobas morio TaxID=2755281 RepID=A0AA38M1Z4_9CUCU|nr:hypothetical protein Zmor_004057 [Zophobas morio]